MAIPNLSHVRTLRFLELVSAHLRPSEILKLTRLSASLTQLRFFANVWKPYADRAARHLDHTYPMLVDLYEKQMYYAFVQAFTEMWRKKTFALVNRSSPIGNSCFPQSLQRRISKLIRRTIRESRPAQSAVSVLKATRERDTPAAGVVVEAHWPSGSNVLQSIPDLLTIDPEHYRARAAQPYDVDHLNRATEQFYLTDNFFNLSWKYVVGQRRLDVYYGDARRAENVVFCYDVHANRFVRNPAVCVDWNRHNPREHVEAERHCPFAIYVCDSYLPQFKACFEFFDHPFDLQPSASVASVTGCNAPFPVDPSAALGVDPRGIVRLLMTLTATRHVAARADIARPAHRAAIIMLLQKNQFLRTRLYNAQSGYRMWNPTTYAGLSEAPLHKIKQFQLYRPSGRNRSFIVVHFAIGSAGQTRETHIDMDTFFNAMHVLCVVAAPENNLPTNTSAPVGQKRPQQPRAPPESSTTSAKRPAPTARMGNIASYFRAKK